MPRPPEITIPAEVSSGRSDLLISARTKDDRPESPVLSTAGRPAARFRTVECRDTNRDHFDRVGGLHRRNRIARIDRPFERVRRLHATDLRDLLDVEQGRDTRHQILAVGGCGRQHVAVVGRQINHKRGNVFGQHVAQFGCVGAQHLGNACDLRRGFRNGTAIAAGDQNIDIAADFGRGGYRVQRRPFELSAVMFGDYQIAHR